MCLDAPNIEEIQEKIKATIPEDGLVVYKVVGMKDDKYYPIHKKIRVPYEEGIDVAQVAKTKSIWFRCSMDVPSRSDRAYFSGYHFWMEKKSAKKLLEKIKDYQHRGRLNQHMFEGEYTIISCIVKKEWITEIGPETVENFKGRVVVAEEAIFPKFKGNKQCV